MFSLEYIAGFFDGEGCVGCYRNGQRKGRSIRVQLTQNESVLVNGLFRYLVVLYGGAVSRQLTRTQRFKLNWQISGKNAERFLKDIEPYAYLKKPQITLALRFLEFSEHRVRRDSKGRILPCTDEYHYEGLLLEARLKALKKPL